MKILQKRNTLLSFGKTNFIFYFFMFCLFKTFFSYAYADPSLESESKVAIIVSGNPITSYDIAHRIALLRLQHRTGDLKKTAENELINETLQRIEAHRLNMTISEDQVNQAYADFSANNRIAPAQFSIVLNDAGVTAQHFKTYLQAQIEWGRIISARYHSEKSSAGGMISLNDAVQRMIRDGGKKPSVREYKLKQIILVIPPKKRTQILAKRLKEAQSIRAKFSDCNQLRNATKGIIDVTLRDLGRILEPQLPPEWKKAVIAAGNGKVTPPLKSPLGLEMLAVCQVRNVSDDRTAQLIFSIKDSQQNNQQNILSLSKKYLKELRDRARIQYKNN